MPYKPKYCCQCGEKIERADWKFWHSHRFCEFCSTEYRIYDLILPVAGFLSLLVLFAFSGYFQKSAKPVNVSLTQTAGFVSNSKKISANQNAAPTNLNIVPTTAQTDKNATLVKSPAAQTSSAKPLPSENAAEPAEKVDFCGAATRKGTPCSRRVRGGGRCWQHEGLTAMTTQEKLAANR